jgi:4-hydroxy 2-oxovalerate aldolase
MKKPRILDCTLRDGSYVIDFQFTKKDTELICKALEGVGVDMIEVGHGMGLGASRKNRGVAAEDDQVYLEASAATVKNADWGMFCIPGIAELSDVDLAAKYKMDFIRIGTNVEDYKESKAFIERAKKHGMYVCSNFMKSYVLPPDQFAKHAKEAAAYGSDLIYIVDSAGGMFPDDITKYVEALRDAKVETDLGFHGHNNLGLAIANTLRACELGVSVVDCSLQGFGRSAGNAPTEQLLCALIRFGVDMNIDPVALMDIGEKHIIPLIENRGINSVDTVAGLALFHSSYMPIIEKFAKQYSVDPRHLILSVCKYDKTNAPATLVEREAKRLAESGVKGNWKPLYRHYYGGEQG